MDEMIKKTAETLGAVTEPNASKANHVTGARRVIVPNKDLLLGEQDPLKTEQEIWRDRLAVMQRSATSPGDTVKGHVDRFVAVKTADVAAGELPAGRAVKLRLYLTEFADWVGHDTAVTEITGQTLSDYRLELLKRVESQTWSRPTAKDRLDSVKSFVRWLWQIEAIASLPRILDGKSQSLQIGAAPPRIVIFTKQEIDLSLAKACDRSWRLSRGEAKLSPQVGISFLCRHTATSFHVGQARGNRVLCALPFQMVERFGINNEVRAVALGIDDLKPVVVLGVESVREFFCKFRSHATIVPQNPAAGETPSIVVSQKISHFS